MSCKPRISGCMLSIGTGSFFDCSDLYCKDSKAWGIELDDMQRFGIDLICCWSGVEEGVERSAAVGNGSLLDYLFEETERRGMSISLSSGFRHGFWEDWEIRSAVEFTRDYTQRMNLRYRKHLSFSSWYLDYEIYLNFGEERKKIINLYRDLTSICHDINGKPVIVSPFFMPNLGKACGDYPYARPEEYYDFWCEVLSTSKIDILSLQDNGGQHLSCITDMQRRSFTQPVIRACLDTGTTYWGNVESGELPVASPEDFAARYGFGTSVNAPLVRPFWQNVPMEKLTRKLQMAATDAEKIMSWGYQEFFRPSLGHVNQENYREYLAYRDTVLRGK